MMWESAHMGSVYTALARDSLALLALMMLRRPWSL